MIEEYTPQVGDIVKMFRGRPDNPGYVESVYIIVGSDEKSNLSEAKVTPELFVRLMEIDMTKDVELIKRLEPKIPMKQFTLGWANWCEYGRFPVRYDASTELWEIYDSNGTLIKKETEEVLFDFEEATLVPKKLVDHVGDWANYRDPHVIGADLLREIAGYADE